MTNLRYVDRNNCARFLLLAWTFLAWTFLVWMFVGGSWLMGTEPGDEPGTATQTPASLREYRSQFLVVYTDLPPDEAKRAVQNLERTLSFASRYWGQDPRGQIECYLLQDPEKLADADLPHRLARVLVGGVGGATLPNRSRSAKGVRNLPTIFASTTPGVAEHELVHAYCTQTFGFTGPEWYKEGMAEMVVQKCTRDSGVVCTAEQLQFLRNNQQTTINEVLAGGNASRRILDSLNIMLANPKNHDRQIPMSDWGKQDTANVASAREENLRSWALCYLLLHNPNYSSRFKMLGRKYVNTNEADFAGVFASMQREIAFEYSFFLQNICVGYRIDLCSWDWNKRFHRLGPSESISVRVGAGQGYQASGLSVVEGQKYSYDAVGTWSTSRDMEATAADGRADHSGRLFGVVMRDFQLSEPFPLGIKGTFRSPISGNLFLRCNDNWNTVHDNQGQTVVRLQE